MPLHYDLRFRRSLAPGSRARTPAYSIMQYELYACLEPSGFLVYFDVCMQFCSRKRGGPGAGCDRPGDSSRTLWRGRARGPLDPWRRPLKEPCRAGPACCAEEGAVTGPSRRPLTAVAMKNSTLEGRPTRGPRRAGNNDRDPPAEAGNADSGEGPVVITCISFGQQPHVSGSCLTCIIFCPTPCDWGKGSTAVKGLWADERRGWQVQKGCRWGKRVGRDSENGYSVHCRHVAAEREEI